MGYTELVVMDTAGREEPFRTKNGAPVSPPEGKMRYGMILKKYEIKTGRRHPQNEMQRPYYGALPGYTPLLFPKMLAEGDGRR